LAGEFLKHIIGHVETCALSVKLLLAQVEAVGAVQVADGTSWLEHDVKRWRQILVAHFSTFQQRPGYEVTPPLYRHFFSRPKPNFPPTKVGA